MTSRFGDALWSCQPHSTRAHSYLSVSRPNTTGPAVCLQPDAPRGALLVLVVGRPRQALISLLRGLGAMVRQLPALQCKVDTSIRLPAVQAVVLEHDRILPGPTRVSALSPLTPCPSLSSPKIPSDPPNVSVVSRFCTWTPTRTFSKIQDWLSRPAVTTRSAPWPTP